MHIDRLKVIGLHKINWWPWHLGVVPRHRPTRVYHFKRTRDRQFWAPFYFEGRLRRTRFAAVQRTGAILWVRPAWQVVPWLLLLVALALPLWMVVAAVQWPVWLARGAAEARSRR